MLRSAKLSFALPLLLCALPVRANLTITPTYTAAILNDPNAADIQATINSAIQMYQSTYTNAANVTITFDEMSDGLGQSFTYYGTVNYTDYVSHLRNTKPGSPLLTYVPNSNPVNSSTKINVTTANLHAVGYPANYITLPTGATDSTISINIGLTNITRTGPQDPDHYDLMAVAEHEIDEALGLGSALNGLSDGSPVPTGAIRALDLFRYSAPGTRSFTPSASATSYFSVDNGATNIVGFNQDGDGSDYQDWADTPGTPRVQDAFGTPGAQPNFGFAESTALQAVGYNVANLSAPEPSPLASLGIGMISLSVMIVKASRRVQRK